MSRMMRNSISDAFSKLPANIRAWYCRHARVIKRITFAAIVVIVVCCCGLRIYLHREERRALLLLSEATSINVGESEATVLPLVARAGGKKWQPAAAPACDNCINADKSGDGEALPYEYSYVIRISPFQVFSTVDGHTSSWRNGLAYIMSRFPRFLRELVGLRNWMIVAAVCIHEGRVVGVTGSTYVEGRARWLGSTWRRFDGSPVTSNTSSAYSVELGHLEMTSGGEIIEQFLTKSATYEQIHATLGVNEHCITGLIPCDSLCDLKPGLFRDLREHSEIQGNFDTRNYCSVRVNGHVPPR